MKDVLMIVHIMGTMLPSDNDRFSYIANMLLDKGADVEMVTSDFEHHKKKYRDREIAKLHRFKITFLHEDQYYKNVSLDRIKGHVSFAKRLKEYLRNRKKPDVIYCAVPPTISASVAADYARKNNIKFVVDVQDLWPESFSLILGNSAISKLVLKPLTYFADKTYAAADVVCAVSDTFLQRAESVNHRAKTDLSIFLGTDGERSENAVENSKYSNRVEGNGKFNIAYVGNLGISYDFIHVIKAVSALKRSGISDMKVWFIGDGTERNKIEEWIKQYDIDAEITGYLPYRDMLKVLIQCDIALNPILANTQNTIVNKVGDYAWGGVPVVNSQPTEEYRRLLDTYNAGINVTPEDTKSIATGILKLYKDSELRKTLGRNNRRLFVDKFDREKTYPALITAILQ